MWVLLAAFAWSQLAFAAHQFSHEADELASVCAVCLHAERADEVAPNAECDVWVPEALPGFAASEAASVPSEPFRLYQSRASPRIL